MEWEGDLVLRGIRWKKFKLHIKMGQCFVKCFANLDFCPKSWTEPVSGSSVSKDNSHLCGSFESLTSLSKSGCGFWIP